MFQAKKLRLTVEREKRNMTKFALGAAVNIHPSNIGKFESGRLKPYPPEAKRLEDFFGIPGKELFQEVEQNE